VQRIVNESLLRAHCITRQTGALFVNKRRFFSSTPIAAKRGWTPTIVRMLTKTRGQPSPPG
jgi:hypothetical protein